MKIKIKIKKTHQGLCTSLFPPTPTSHTIFFIEHVLSISNPFQALTFYSPSSSTTPRHRLRSCIKGKHDPALAEVFKVAGSFFKDTTTPAITRFNTYIHYCKHPRSANTSTFCSRKNVQLLSCSLIR